MTRKSKKTGCGCLNVLFLIALLGVGYGWLNRSSHFPLSQFFSNSQKNPPENISISTPPSPSPSPTPVNEPISRVATFPFPENVPQGMTINLETPVSMSSINQAIKESFEENFSGTKINITTNDSDKSIDNLLADQMDIAVISRPLTEAEKQQGLVAIPIPQSSLPPYQQLSRNLSYVYKAPATPSVQAFLGYVTSPLVQRIIETAKFKRSDPKVTQNTLSQKAVSATPQPTITPEKSPSPQQPSEKKAIRGIYLSRYQITNNASEQAIRERVRYYRSQGINTIIHGVWGNGCTMYNSEVMQHTLGFKSCPNLFRDQWLDWLIDEAHKQGMEVHAYFEKGIKIDPNSPIFKQAVVQKWLVPGVDKTYTGIEHYVLDVEVPEVANFFKNIVVEFVEKYPNIDAVQWDDYLGYHAELPGQVDRTANLTQFIQQMITAMKEANPSVSFDLCHHNPYWAKRYFAADWENWDVDRVFIQAYNEKNFQEELNYAQNYAGIAITDQQFHRLEELMKNPKVNSILLFPLDGQPEKTASKFSNLLQSNQ